MSSSEGEEWEDPGFPERRPLTTTLLSNGQPVWGPPDVDVSDLIDVDVHTDMRKAIMDFTNGDPAMTTEFLDWELEANLDERYATWARACRDEMRLARDDEGALFFSDLKRELEYDGNKTYDTKFERVGAVLGYQWLGRRFEVKCDDPFSPMWGGDPRKWISPEEDYAIIEEVMARHGAKRRAALIPKDSRDARLIALNQKLLETRKVIERRQADARAHVAAARAQDYTPTAGIRQRRIFGLALLTHQIPYYCRIWKGNNAHAFLLGADYTSMAGNRQRRIFGVRLLIHRIVYKWLIWKGQPLQAFRGVVENDVD